MEVKLRLAQYFLWNEYGHYQKLFKTFARSGQSTQTGTSVCVKDRYVCLNVSVCLYFFDLHLPHFVYLAFTWASCFGQFSKGFSIWRWISPAWGWEVDVSSSRKITISENWMIIFLPVLLALIFKTSPSAVSWVLKKVIFVVQRGISLKYWFDWCIDLIHLYCCMIALIVLGN